MLDFALNQKRTERPGRRFAGLIGLALIVAAACASLIATPIASASPSTRQVTYRGYAVKVPASWPVYHLAADPSQCVRFDRHAVYLGRPGANQRCPAQAVGRTEAILIEPLSGAAAPARQPDRITLSRSRVAPPALPPASSAQVLLAIPAAGVSVTATWRRDPGTIKRIVHGARHIGGPTPATVAAPTSAAPPRPLRTRRASATATASYFTGLGFDACATPSTATMSAWSASPYRGIGIYIGGVNRGCSQPNLSAAWVSAEIAAGWHLIPTYVGLQAPGNSCGCAAIQPAQAAAQGAAAADDAVAQAGAVGIGTGNPIYFDMEGYATGGSTSAAVGNFLRAWTGELHAKGYVSGVYGSVSSTISDLVAGYGTSNEPDDVWIANWNGQATTADPAVPAADWPNHQRLHQYRGGHNETYGGATINIDNDYLDGAVVGTASPPVVVRRGRCAKVLFKRHSRFGAFKIRTFNVQRCVKARKVAGASRPSRFGPLGGARLYTKKGFTCRGNAAGRAGVIYECLTAKAQIRFERTG